MTAFLDKFIAWLIQNIKRTFTIISRTRGFPALFISHIFPRHFAAKSPCHFASIHPSNEVYDVFINQAQLDYCMYQLHSRPCFTHSLSLSLSLSLSSISLFAFIIGQVGIDKLATFQCVQDCKRHQSSYRDGVMSHDMSHCQIG